MKVYPFIASSSETDDPDTSATAPLITTTDIPTTSTDAEYSTTLAAVGSAPITWTLSDGTLPDGLSLSSSGTISGTPTEPGAFTFTVKAANSAGEDTKLFTLIVPFSEIRAPKITTKSLAAGYVNSPYGLKLTATGTSTGLTSLTWSADNLPAGLSLNTSGYLSGTPASADTSNITVWVSNAIGTDSADFPLKISATPANSKPAITAELHPAAAGLPYSCQLTASGTPPFTWTLKGKLPAGLSMNSTGLITGTPAKKGNKKLSFTVSNDYGTETKKLTLSVYDLPEITTETLKDATVAKKYNQTIKKKGTKPLTWELEGSLPNGITFNDSKAKISGKPTVNDSGMIRVTLTNPAGELSKVYTLKVNAKLPVISPKTLKKGTYGKSYKVSVKAKGTEPITLILSGDLPEGLSFDSSTGKIEGTPSEVCTDRAITIIAANMGGVVSKDYTLTIKAVAPKITTKKLPDGVSGTAYTLALEATGTPAITWTASGLPDGLSMNTSGEISGTPTESGKFRVEVKAANSAKTAKKNYTLKISGSESSAKISTAKITGSKSSAASSREGEVLYEKVSAFTETGGGVQGLHSEGSAVFVEGEYIIAAELGEVSVDVSGMYDFADVVLDERAKAGEKLLWLANSSTHSEDDNIAEFSDDDGREINTVPESRKVHISVWLSAGKIYRPAVAVKQ